MKIMLAAVGANLLLTAASPVFACAVFDGTPCSQSAAQWWYTAVTRAIQSATVVPLNVSLGDLACRAMRNYGQILEYSVDDEEAA